MAGIHVAGQLFIPESELDWTFTTSGGPGGQHANRTESRVVLEWDYEASRVASADQRRRLARYGRPAPLRVMADQTRSQHRNREEARRQMARLIAEALRPRRSRRPTKPTSASKRRRLDQKRRRGETKALRRRPEY